MTDATTTTRSTTQQRYTTDKLVISDNATKQHLYSIPAGTDLQYTQKSAAELGRNSHHTYVIYQTKKTPSKVKTLPATLAEIMNCGRSCN